MRFMGVSVLAAALTVVGIGITPHGPREQSVDSDQAAVPVAQVALSGPLRITTSTRIAPGTYRVSVPKGTAAIEIDADSVTLDLSGVTLIGSADDASHDEVGPDPAGA